MTSASRGQLVRELLVASQDVLLGRLDSLDAAALHLLTEGQLTADAAAATRRTAHQLISLSAFGVLRGGQLAMRAEAILSVDGMAPAEQGAALAELSAGIRAELEEALAEPAQTTGPAEAVRPVDDVPDVLLVEDDTVLVQLLTRALEGAGYTVAHVADGPTAVQTLDVPVGQRPRLVLLDIDLPALDGFGVLRALSQRGLIPGLDVLCLTARASEPDVVSMLSLGAVDHVAKPFSLPVLLARVARALG